MTTIVGRLGYTVSVPPFAKITAADFAPALDIAMQDDLAKLMPLPKTQNRDIRQYHRSIETTSELMHKVLSPFYAMAGAHTNPELDALMREFSPLLPRMGPRHKRLCFSVLKPYGIPHTLGLSEEQTMLLKDQYLACAFGWR